MLTATSVGISTDVAVIYFLKEDIGWTKRVGKNGVIGQNVLV